MSDSGVIVIPEGKIFWELSSPEGSHKSPVLLFIHAGIADHTLWQDQVQYFVSKGWSVLTFDTLGFGQSTVSEEWCGKVSQMKVEHWKIVGHLLNKISQPVVAIGCSMGGKTAIETALAYPDRVKGLVAIGAPVPGLDLPENPDESKVLEQEVNLEKEKDSDGLAEFWVKYWGDGALQREGRADAHVREKMLAWAKPAAAAKVSETGGMAVGYLSLKPLAVTRLEELKIPVAGVLGVFDETFCQDAMRYLAKNVPKGICKEFQAAHLPSLELPDEFNEWLESWLADNF